jgi:hypothetical protein
MLILMKLYPVDVRVSVLGSKLNFAGVVPRKLKAVNAAYIVVGL